MARIVVDAMGGDSAPEEIVRGVALASVGPRPLQLMLVGDERRISALLAQEEHDAERIEIFHAPEAIGMDEKPGEAIRRKKRASILVGAELVAADQGDALVSAGNTGACVLACSTKFKKIPGVKKAGLASVYPTEARHGEKEDPFSLILDVGATVEVEAEDLVAFALMGSAYARAISKNPSPKVALLSNGTEPTKGPKAVVEAYKLLSQHKGIHFIGNVEGIDIPRGTADVVVTNGFVGNVVLKMLEGIGETVLELARYAYKEKVVWRMGLYMLSGGIERLKEVTDWEQYGGAPILGFDHLFIKAHGRSRARAIRNAILVAAKAVDAKLPTVIQTGLEEFKRITQAHAADKAPPPPPEEGV
ncbi:MAG TPA: phosphate acyltransferase PlsX [Myxococcota bacterium]|jgi:glycerol-3-phosphate acyltransferase PlsX|nr:phosphate acyltransferase PlsX [Myxococcota bacterium]